MKRFAKTIGKVFIGLIFIILFILSLFVIFQEKIIVFAIRKGIEYVDPTITTGNIEVSNLWDYPEMIVQIDHTNVPGTLPRQTAPLLNCKHLEVHVNLAKLLAGKLIIDKVYLQEPKIKARINEKGQSNFDFGKEESQTEEEEESNPPEITIREFIISKASIQTDIDTSNQHLQLQIDTLHTPLTYNADGIDCRPYLHLLTTQVQLDTLHILENRSFALDGGIGFRTANTQLILDSTFLLLDEQKFLFDGQFTADSIPYINMMGVIYPDTLQDFLDLVPPQYLSMLDTLEIEGIIGASFQIKGKLDTTEMPFVTIGIDFEQGRFALLEQHIEIKDLQFNSRFTTGERKNLSDAFLSVQNLAFRYNDNPVSGTLEAQNLQDPDLNLHLNALADLSTFQTQLKEKGVELLQGRLNCELYYMGNLNALKALKAFPKGHIILDDLHVKHAQYPHRIDIKRLNADFDKNLLTFDLSELFIGKSNISNLQASIERPVGIYQNEEPLRASFLLEAPFLYLDELQGEPKSGKSAYPLKNLLVESHVDMDAAFFTSSGQKRNIKLYQSRLAFDHDTLQKTFTLQSGKITLMEDDLHIENLSSQIEDSDLNFSLDVQNLNALKSETTDTIHAKATLTSKYLDMKKLSQGEITMEPLKDLIIVFDIKASNEWLHLKEGQKLAYLDVRIDTFHGAYVPHLEPLKINKCNFTVTREEIEIRDFNLFYKQSDLHTTIRIKQPEELIAKNYQKAEIYGRISSDHLNLDQLAFLWEKDSTQIEEEKPDSVIVETDTIKRKTPTNKAFPKMDFELDLADIYYNGGHTDLVYFCIKSDNTRTIFLDPFKLYSGKGRIDGSGYITLLDNGKTEFRNVFVVDSINMSQFLGSNLEESELRVYGDLNADITSRLLFSPEGEFELDQSQAVLKFEVIDGRIVNFEPFTALALFFEIKEMRDLQFEELENTIDFDGEYFYIPEMIVKTNAGDIQLSGKQNVKGQMDYHVAVPFRLINIFTLGYINKIPKTIFKEIPLQLLTSDEVIALSRTTKALHLTFVNDIANKIFIGLYDQSVRVNEKGEYVLVEEKAFNPQLPILIQGTTEDYHIGYDIVFVFEKLKYSLYDRTLRFFNTFENQKQNLYD